MGWFMSGATSNAPTLWESLSGPTYLNCEPTVYQTCKVSLYNNNKKYSYVKYSEDLKKKNRYVVYPEDFVVALWPSCWKCWSLLREGRVDAKTFSKE